MREKKIFFAQCIIVCGIIGIILAVNLFFSTKETTTQIYYQDLEKLHGKKLGVVTGTVSADVGKEYYPDSELVYYDDTVSCLMSLSQGKIDGCLSYLENLEEISTEYSDIKCLPGIIKTMTYSIVMQKNEDGVKLGKEYDEFILKLKENGYTPKFEEVSLSAELAGLSTVRYDVGANGVMETPERVENLTFTLPFGSTDVVMFVKDENAATQKSQMGILEKIKGSFEKNFITESRWKWLLNGLGVTILMAFLVMIIGTLIGAIICALHLSKNPFGIGFARMYIKFFQGMPIVVLLLILYYVIFAKTSLSSFVVCVVGFSIDFSAYVSEIFRTGIESVPAGQRRAAYALGYGKASTFTKVVFPQMFLQVLPVYCGQLVAMVKMTSVAGYISVEDLTKVSDIIRSRTYEAFFPLIFTAIIYFLIASLLTMALKALQRKLEPKKRRR